MQDFGQDYGHDERDGARAAMPGPRLVEQHPANIGSWLRAARESKGLDLGEMSRTTKISVRHLAALEEGDYAAMPARMYAVGFARTYARALGLEADDVAREVRGELERSESGPAPRPINQFDIGSPAKTPSRALVWASLAAVVVLVVAGLSFWRSYYAPAAALPALDQPVDSAAPSAAAPVAAPAPAAGGAVTFTSLDDGVWVKFSDNGQQLLQKQLAKGESFSLPATAQAPVLWTGRPEALAITVGGKPVAPIATTQKIVKDVPVSAAALLARPAVALDAPAPGKPAGVKPAVVARPSRQADLAGPGEAAASQAASPAPAPTMAVPQVAPSSAAPST